MAHIVESEQLGEVAAGAVAAMVQAGVACLGLSAGSGWPTLWRCSSSSSWERWMWEWVGPLASLGQV